MSEQVRGGFLASHAVAVDQHRQSAVDPQFFDGRPGVAAGRCNAKTNVRPIEQIKEIGNAGQQIARRKPLQQSLKIRVLAIHHRLPRDVIDRATLQQQLQRFAARYAAQELVVGARKGDALLVGQALPCLVMEFGGVGDDPVQVKYDGFDRVRHGIL